MLKKKSIGVALACALAIGAFSGSALATPTNVNGVVIDTSNPLNFQIKAIGFRETSIAQVGDMLTGYGVVGQINDDINGASFCPGCNLNFTFSYTVKSIDPGTGNNTTQIVFDGGLIDLFVDDSSSFSETDPSTAGIGTPWLSLAGHNATYTQFSTDGDLFSTVVGPVGAPLTQSGGFGLLDVVGGPSASFFDTNSQTDGSDFTFSSSFLTNDKGICADDGTCYPISGTATLIGDTVSVPEPGAAGLLGLGLA